MTNGFKIKAKLIFVKPKQKPNKNNSREKNRNCLWWEESVVEVSF